MTKPQHSPPEFDVANVKGNAPDNVKEIVDRLRQGFLLGDSRGFADTVGQRIRLAEVSFKQNPNAAGRQIATVVNELEVHEDMVNGAGHLHGGCSAYLMDVCTSLPLGALLQRNPGVSQSLNMVYHAPATIGTRLRVVSTSIAIGGRTMVARGEIWDADNSRLVASGVHIKMQPSESKL